MEHVASRETFDEQDWKELVLIDANGKEKEWYCPLTVLEMKEDGSIYIENHLYDYYVDKSEYSTYRVQECTCSPELREGEELQTRSNKDE